MALKKSEEVVELKEIKINQFQVKIVGNSPLIVHAWDEKAINMMLGQQMKKATAGKEAKNPIGDFINSLYWLSGKPEEMTEEAFEEALKKGAKFGFPSIGVKESVVSAGYRSKMSKDKVSLYGSFHIDEEFIVIKGIPNMRQDMVRIGMGTADIRFRGEYKEWSSEFVIKYNEQMISPEIIVNMINIAGFSVGLGEWRPEKGGRSGMFSVAA